MLHTWQLAKQTDIPLALREAVGGHRLVARLLAQRVQAGGQAGRAAVAKGCPAAVLASEGAQVRHLAMILVGNER